MKTLRSQIVATTELDRHGDTIPRYVLEHMYSQIPDPWLMMDNHDPSLPAIARGYNKQFVQLDNGHWAIRADVEVFDESKLAKYGGFSMTFSGKRYSLNLSRVADVTLEFNPRVFEARKILEICSASNGGLQVDALEIHQKGMGEYVALGLSFGSAAILSGFLQEAGKDSYTALKKKILELAKAQRDEESQGLKCQMAFTFERHGGQTEVLVSVDAEDLEYLEAKGLDAQYVIERVNEAVGPLDVRKVVLKAVRDSPIVSVTYFIDRDENLHEAENG
ncbi:hypothetical protein [Candidatus Laterigemmans baculatus]|uniref:hypothetical protein n=1 Tax=Candidatus Laterigemmans baculatus TaxID=2770505 RepID=UPI0013DCB1A4|nr:hypothetical protein [Candidatus Laterigemmans baculatus]